MTWRRRFEMARVLWGALPWDYVIGLALFNPDELERRYNEEIAFWERMESRWQ